MTLSTSRQRVILVSASQQYLNLMNSARVFVCTAKRLVRKCSPDCPVEKIPTHYRNSAELAGSSNFDVHSINCSAGEAFMRSVSKLIAWLCLLLMLLSAYIFAAHQHSSSSDDAQCTICVVAHSASPASSSTSLTAVFVLVVAMVVAEAISAKQRLISFALSVRPPPAV